MINSKPSQAQQAQLQKSVIRMIKNKLEPLNMRYYDFKYQTVQTQILKSNNLQKQRQLCSQPLSQKMSQQKQNVHKRQRKYRKALIFLPHQNSPESFERLQRKVERHLQMYRIMNLQKNYIEREQRSLTKKKITVEQQEEGPLKKYLQLFHRVERPSEKAKIGQEQEYYLDLLKKVETAKSQKHIQQIKDNLPGFWNLDKIDKKKNNRPPLKRSTNREQYKQMPQMLTKISKRDNKRLKSQILKDIQNQYKQQGSSKIRINMNHKKMINMK